MGKERGLDLLGCNNLVLEKAMISNQKGNFPVPDISPEPVLMLCPPHVAQGVALSCYQPQVHGLQFMVCSLVNCHPHGYHVLNIFEYYHI